MLSHFLQLLIQDSCVSIDPFLNVYGLNLSMLSTVQRGGETVRIICLEITKYPKMDISFTEFSALRPISNVTFLDTSLHWILHF